MPLPRWQALGLKGAAGGLVPGEDRPLLIREGPAPGCSPGWPLLPATTGETQASAGPGFSSILPSCPRQRETAQREVTQRRKDACRSARTGGPRPHGEVMQELRARVQSSGWRYPGPPGASWFPLWRCGAGGGCRPGQGPQEEVVTSAAWWPATPSRESVPTAPAKRPFMTYLSRSPTGAALGLERRWGASLSSGLSSAPSPTAALASSWL